MAAHLAALGAMMWRHARVPGVMWFPRIETATCLAILPGLAYGAAGGWALGGCAARGGASKDVLPAAGLAPPGGVHSHAGPGIRPPFSARC